jgi:hypothetical protein
MRRALLAILLAACGAPDPHCLGPRPGEAEAVALVAQVYGVDQPPLPAIAWWDEPCPGDPRSAVFLDGQCLHGAVLYPTPAGWCPVQVAWRSSYAASALAHELMHFWQLPRLDPAHTSPEWSREADAVAALRAAGL